MIGNPLRRLPTIRAKLGSTIIVAVVATLGLVYLLLSFALRNDFREAELVELLEIAQAQSRLEEPVPPSGVSIAVLTGDAFRWIGPTLAEPPRFAGGVHVGTIGDIAYAAVPARAVSGANAVLYAISLEPDVLTASSRFLREYLPQLLLSGALGATIAILLARLLARGMTQPLRDMAEAARRMETGDYDQRVETDSLDEVGRLAAAFNRMAGELRSVESLRRDLVANVSHELRTPLSVLRANLENLVDGVGRPDPATLATMLSQTDRLGRLVAQLLDLAQLESGEATLRRESVSVPSLVDRVLDELEVARADRGLALVREIAPEALAVEGDGERLHQVLFNLLDNAVRFTPAGGRVVVRARAHDATVRLEVEDTGPGIPPELRERVFERFFTVDPSRSRGEGGTGIGLAIARSIVDAHGGRIWAEPGDGGSRFVVELPVGAST